MDLRALRYFVEVVRQNGFTRAANTLHVTQPTISKMVKSLEDELGGPLLLREGRSVRLTDAGKVVYVHGLTLLDEARRLKQEVAEVDGIARGELSVGIMPTAGHYMAPVIALFQQRHPGVVLQVDEQGASAQRQALLDGKLDMTLGLLSEPDPELQTTTIARQTTRVAMAAHRVEDANAPLAWRDLRDKPFVLYTPGFKLHQAVLEQCARAGFEPHIRLQSRYWDFIGDLVAQDVGIAVMFEHVIARYDPARVASRPLVDPVLSWDVVLMWRPGYLSRAARAWLDCVREIYPASTLGAVQ
ncbi:LysR family transcriptional regulator [Diaphorobacter sp. HDW4A]|uniref:LysR family transcriptional regulator n=1 Tax=Diaphorobacter sp. HDW4A TaxID=2714924 RepID=UPI00140DBA49|nr:LysR substrate-binding domain-containing protein [Diaphorobacter sp. HDW4A]QIL82784.1 LysR family transcriptional regulator [Diaphorobacter sp. HDW4A]